MKQTTKATKKMIDIEQLKQQAGTLKLHGLLVHHSEVIAIEGASYRMKEAKEQAAKRRSRKK